MNYQQIFQISQKLKFKLINTIDSENDLIVPKN